MSDDSLALGSRRKLTRYAGQGTTGASSGTQMLDITPTGPISSPFRAQNETALPLHGKDPLGLIEQPLGHDDSAYSSLQGQINKMQEEEKQQVMADFGRLESYNAAAFETQKKDINDL